MKYSRLTSSRTSCRQTLVKATLKPSSWQLIDC